MISDVTLSALANWLGSLAMIMIVLYHVSISVSGREQGDSGRGRDANDVRGFHLLFMVTTLTSTGFQR